jgi:UDP:flavonoid glycosyltransferase YjiC (YdhE family)
VSTRRILFFAESVTLAHLGRPVALARQLDRRRFEPVIAAGRAYRELVADETVPFRDLATITGEQFLYSLAKGQPVYSFPVLRGYVEEDLRHIHAVKPDVVVGDFRLSLSVSARLARVPYVAIANAYWSPFAKARWEIPSHPAVKFVGPRIAGAGFRAVRPIAFALHSLPMHRLRRSFGLPSLGFDLRRVYTDGDWTLYADIPELVPTPCLPQGGRHVYIGAVPWSPAVELPEWWGNLPADLPLIYLTMGSSGRGATLRAALDAVRTLPCVAAVAGAGVRFGGGLPRNAFVADYLPGELVMRTARVAVCNGGSPTTQQALTEGVPVLGLAENLDQYLNMGFVEAFGAGLMVRADIADAASIRAGLLSLLEDDRFVTRARAAARAFSRYDSAVCFENVLRAVDGAD